VDQRNTGTERIATVKTFGNETRVHARTVRTKLSGKITDRKNKITDRGNRRREDDEDSDTSG
jgi:hypothetical protein